MNEKKVINIKRYQHHLPLNLTCLTSDLEIESLLRLEESAEKKCKLSISIIYYMEKTFTTSPTKTPILITSLYHVHKHLMVKDISSKILFSMNDVAITLLTY